ncbi:T9SS type A sorting domain-containing protein [Mangrovivirga sp. M17]|uniref:T9SS type A sorting domain-containing protein n=1 Tax=Mangrovivirga halotolerans TaxID=2993936 RepID=A0ABT3RM37_9BACT|nr:ELWxxDGT repeat protein [Mangrovivirga halotolerans]MCX2742662.1 T9SS type A sorting domain-containing protein [Mangrovivirga halotolerans]
MAIFFNHSGYSQTQVTTETSPGEHSGRPLCQAQINDKLFFTAYTEDLGYELWVLDVSDSSIYNIMDINPGPGSFSGSLIQYRDNFVTYKSKLYFFANDGVRGYQLWRTDGTFEGTEKVTNLENAINNSSLTHDYSQLRLAVVNDKLFFLYDNNEKYDLYSFDETDDNLSLVKSELSGYFYPDMYDSLAGNFIFNLWSGENNKLELWISDGTTNGTKPIVKSSEYYHRATGKAHNRDYYYIAFNRYGKDNGPETNLMKYNLDLNSSDTIQNIFYDFSGFINVSYSIIGDNLFVLGTNQNTPEVRLFKINLSDNSSELIFNQVQPGYFKYSNLYSGNQKLYFTTQDQSDRILLYELNPNDGTITNYELISNLNSEGYSNKFEDKITRLNENELLIQMQHDDYEWKYWVFNTINSTLSKINHSFYSSTHPIYFNNELIGTMRTDSLGIELVAITDDYQSTRLVKNINKAKNAIDSKSINIINHDIIYALNSSRGGKLKKLNAINLSSTTLLDNTYIFTYFNSMAIQDNQLFFKAYTEQTGRELWGTDGTIAGTKILDDLIIGPESSDPNYFAVSGGNLYFIVNLNDTDRLYKYDGQSMMEVYDFQYDDYGIPKSASTLTPFKDGVFINAYENATSIYFSDGTQSGTIKLAQNEFGIGFYPTSAGEKLYFTGAESGSNPIFSSELYVTDGTPENTNLVYDEFTGINSDVSKITPFNGKVIYTSYSPSSGMEYWISDGTETGTKLLKDIYPGIKSGVPSQFESNYAIMNNELYFIANDGNTGLELWKTDGTEEGTVLVKDLYPGLESSYPNNFTVANGKLYFSTAKSELKPLLWSTNGTEQGTQIVQEFTNIPDYSFPRNFNIINNILYFTAETENHGTQLWRFETPLIRQDNNANKNNLILYPNPVDQILNIEFGFELDRVEILDLEGSMIKSFEGSQTSVNIADLNYGIYLLVGYYGNKKVSQKFIKL